MANQRGPAAPLGVEFAPPHRADRIAALLAPAGDWSAADMPGPHGHVSRLGRAPVGGLEGLDGLTRPPRAARTAAALGPPDGRRQRGRGALRASCAAALVRRSPPIRRSRRLADPARLPGGLRSPGWRCSRASASRSNTCSGRGCPGWTWQRLVRAAAEEVAGAADGPGALGRSAPAGGVAGLARPGRRARPPTRRRPRLCAGHLQRARGHPRCFRGPTARFVWDLARREDSRWVVPLGTCGVPGDAHHDDQSAAWLSGELLPVITDWDQLVEERDAHDRNADRPPPGMRQGSGRSRWRQRRPNARLNAAMAQTRHRRLTSRARRGWSARPTGPAAPGRTGRNRPPPPVRRLAGTRRRCPRPGRRSRRTAAAAADRRRP